MKTIIFILLIFLSVFPEEAATPPVELNCQAGEISAFQGEIVRLSMEIKNNLPVPVNTGKGYFLSYHLYDKNGSLIRFDNRRYRLPTIIKKKSTIRYQYPIFFEYPKAGHYVVEFDIVKEGKFWGADRKWKTASVKLHLKELISVAFKKKYLKTFYHTGNTCIDREQYLLRMTLKNCEKSKNGKIFGFSPGSSYPQIWIRDIATFIGLAKLYYPLKVLETSVERFLENQYQDGEIPDWIDFRSEKDKNSVSTDQESSLVIAAFEIALEKPLWPMKNIRGKIIIDRLESAMEWVWQNRRDHKYQLIWSGYTADWGDLEKSYPDQRAIKLSNRSQKTFSTYTQSKYIQAMDRLIKIFQYLKKEKSAGIWKNRLKIISEHAKKYLYSEEQGYFLIHIVPGANEFRQLEKQILAVGGNAEAILAGLMERIQVKRFLDILESKRQSFQLPNVSFTLLPPYPRNFFPHPLLSSPWQYQNGGQWDWIGGRLVKALYFSNFREQATRYLIEIIRKNLKNFMIFEWESRSGNPGLGSAMSYAGAAGEIGEAIVKGYLGYSQDFYSHRINQTEKNYFLKINKRDCFSVFRNEITTIDIERLKNRLIFITEPAAETPKCFNREGIYRIKPQK
jgi:hypothetical protein